MSRHRGIRLSVVGLAIACLAPLEPAGALAGEETRSVRPADRMIDVGGRKLHAQGKDLEVFDRAFSRLAVTPANPRSEAEYRNVTMAQLRKSRPLPRASAMGTEFSAEAIQAMIRVASVLMAPGSSSASS